MGLDRSRPRECNSLPTLLVSLTHLAIRTILVTSVSWHLRAEIRPTSRRAEIYFSGLGENRFDQEQVERSAVKGQRRFGDLCERIVNPLSRGVNTVFMALWK